MKCTIHRIALSAVLLSLLVSCAKKQEQAPSTQSAPVAVAVTIAAPQREKEIPLAEKTMSEHALREEVAEKQFEDLFQAARMAEDAKEIEALVAGGANLSGRTAHGLTPLMIASRYQEHAPVVAALEGDVLHAQDESGMCALGYAARYNDHTEVLEVLLAEATQSEKDTALLVASQYNTANIVKTLLDGGADRSVRTRRGTKAVYVAASENQDPQVVRLLLSPDQKEKDTALFYAASSNCPEVVSALLEEGASVSQTDRTGATSLMYAARYNLNPEVVSLLVDAGSQVEHRSRFGENALSCALKNNQLLIAKTLVEKGADLNSIQIDGRPVVLYAVESKMDAPAISWMLAHGAKVDAPDWAGNTAFMIAVANDDYGRAKMLLEHGADVDARNKGGETALMQSVRRGNLVAVKVLVEEANADVEKTDPYGLDAAHLAARLGQMEIASYLGLSPAQPKKDVVRSQFSLRRAFTEKGYQLQVGVQRGTLNADVRVSCQEGKGTVAYTGIDANTVTRFLRAEAQQIEGLAWNDEGEGLVSISYPGFGPLDDQIVADWLGEDALRLVF